MIASFDANNPTLVWLAFTASILVFALFLIVGERLLRTARQRKSLWLSLRAIYLSLVAFCSCLVAAAVILAIETLNEMTTASNERYRLTQIIHPLQQDLAQILWAHDAKPLTANADLVGWAQKAKSRGELKAFTPVDDGLVLPGFRMSMMLGRPAPSGESVLEIKIPLVSEWDGRRLCRTITLLEVAHPWPSRIPKNGTPRFQSVQAALSTASENAPKTKADRPFAGFIAFLIDRSAIIERAATDNVCVDGIYDIGDHPAPIVTFRLTLPPQGMQSKPVGQNTTPK